MRRLLPLTACLLPLAGCAAPDVGARLAPRTAEAIDPRLPVENPVPADPADAALVARLASLVDQARAGDAAFQPALETAQRLTAAAGPARTESWVAAHQAVSNAVAAKGPTARALGDINALAAERIAPDSTIGQGDFLAIQAALAEVGTIDRRQAEAVAALENRLGL